MDDYDILDDAHLYAKLEFYDGWAAESEFQRWKYTFGTFFSPDVGIMPSNASSWPLLLVFVCVSPHIPLFRCRPIFVGNTFPPSVTLLRMSLARLFGG